MRTPTPRVLRVAALSALWVAAVVGATVGGLSAVGVIGSGIVAPGPAPLNAAQVESRLAAAPSDAASAPGRTSITGAVDPVQAEVLQAGSGGTIVADCSTGVPRILTVSPAQGFQASEKQDEEGTKVKFTSDQVEIKARLGCAASRPVVTVETTSD